MEEDFLTSHFIIAPQEEGFRAKMWEDLLDRPIRLNHEDDDEEFVSITDKLIVACAENGTEKHKKDPEMYLTQAAHVLLLVY
jgi:hypothetical protein